MWTTLDILSIPISLLPMFIIRFLWRLLDLFDGKFGAALRYLIIKRKLKQCGSRVYIGPQVYVDDFSKVSIGEGTSIHHGCTLLAKGGISIGKNVAIAHQTSIVTGNHRWEDASQSIKHNKVELRSVEILDDVWIGAGVRILAGTQIQSRSIVAAGAVVTTNIESNSIYGGIPAKRLKKI